MEAQSMNAIEQARQYLADKGKTSWSDADIRPMVEGLLACIESPVRPDYVQQSDRGTWEAGLLNVRMADIREEGPSLLQRIKNWWRNR
jgi:hypothetical protein